MRLRRTPKRNQASSRRTGRLSQPIETGIVSWGRDVNEALLSAASTTKPVFALFQEVPGCSGCKQFGADVLSNPIIVDAIHEAFVPLLIHNNTPGPDADALADFGEPAWNYQVVRFLDASGNDLLPRQDRVWETGPLAARMVRALDLAGKSVPQYLRILEQEHSDRLRTVHFSQACFWVGEAQLGAIEGVVTTQAAFMAGHEITTVAFDPNVIAIDQLADEARRRGVASMVFADADHHAALAASGMRVQAVDTGSHRIAPARDQKRQLRGRKVPTGLTNGQLTKLNALLHVSTDAARSYLAPSQLRT